MHWRRASVAAAFITTTAMLAVYSNLHYSGDVYWLLAAGRHTLENGLTDVDPFLTLSQGRDWHNQQWLVGALFHLVWDAGGMALLSVLYGLLLGLAVLPLVLGCRHKRPLQVVGAWVLSLPMLVGLLDPRAQGFSLLAFAILLVLTDVSRRRARVWLIPVLFLAWANLHAAFLVGFLLLALVVLGGEIDRRRGLPGRTFSRRFIAVSLALPATLLTPLGARMLDYVGSLSGREVLPRLTYEWDPSWQHPYTLLYPALVIAYGAWLYRSSVRPWPVEPALVLAGFVVLATTATRQLVWLGPLCFYLLRQLGEPGSLAVSRRLSLPALGMSAAALAAWLVFFGPAPNEPKLMTEAAEYALAHPTSGRVAAPAGTGSYLLWRAPSVKVAVDGRFENYSDEELDGVYDLIGHRGEWRALIERWQVDRVLTRNPRAAAAFRREGWQLRYRSRGQYVLDATRP